MDFQVGDTVKWDSQSGGFLKRKVGTVVGVVPAGYHIDRMRALWSAGWDKPKFPGMQRDHQTYLVRVGNRRRLYWPRVSQLERAAQP